MAGPQAPNFRAHRAPPIEAALILWRNDRAFPRLPGLAYLAKATDFLTACRHADLLGGLGDVADVQWWWREDDFSDPDRQRFFNATDGSTVAMLLLCSHPPTFDYEFLPGVEHTDLGRHVFKTGLNWLENIHDAAMTALASFYVGESHVGLQELAERFGYTRAPHVLSARGFRFYGLARPAEKLISYRVGIS